MMDGGIINTALSTPGAYLTTPADGTISSWRVHGTLVSGGIIRLLVARPGAGGTFTAIASSLPALSADGTTSSPGSAALQLRAGDAISLVIEAQNQPGWSAGVYFVSAAGGTRAGIGMYNVGQTNTPAPPQANQELLYNATVDLFPPSPGALTPTSGPTAGGTTVTITGIHLLVVTGVTFGGLPATSFSASRDPVSLVDTVTAVAPPQAAGPANVVISTAGGSTAAVPAFMYEAPPDTTAPVFTGLALSPTALRPSNLGGPVADGGATTGRVGAAVSYSLSEAATATFTVERAAGKGPECAAMSRRKRCTRYTAVGSFSHAGTAGANQFTFTGRVNDAALRPGRYRLVGSATDAGGNASETGNAAFKILRRR